MPLYLWSKATEDGRKDQVNNNKDPGHLQMGANIKSALKDLTRPHVFHLGLFSPKSFFFLTVSF